MSKTPQKNSVHVFAIDNAAHASMIAMSAARDKMTTSDMDTADKPILIIVTGMPGAGKTTLAAALSDELRLPLIAKQAIQERLFDPLGAESELRELPAHRLMRVVCAVPDDVLRERWRRRATTGERRPGHFNAEQKSALDARLSSGAHNALDLPGERVEVDTSAPVEIAPLIALARTLSA